MTPPLPLASIGSRQLLWRGTLPGAFGRGEVTLGLGQALELVFSAQSLVVNPGAGLEVSLPDLLPEPLRLDRLGIDLRDLSISTQGQPPVLGALELAALERAVRWALARLGWATQNPLGDALTRAGWTQDPLGFLTVLSPRVKGKTVLRLGISPDTEVRLRVSSEGISLSLSPGLRVEVPGLELRIGTLKYLFGRASVSVEELREGGLLRVRQALKAKLLTLISWVASKWLRTQLPYGMRQKGYDWFADPARLAHISYIVDKLKKPKPNVPSAPPASAGDGGLAARLMPKLRTPLQLEDGMQALWRGVVGGGELAVCVRKGASLDVRRGLHHLELHAEGGLFVMVPDLAWAQELRLQRVKVALDDLSLQVETSPALGPLPMALLQRLYQEKVAPALRAAIAQRWGLGGVGGGWDGAEAIVIAHHSLGSAGVLGAYLAVNDALTLRYTGKSFEILAPLGLHVGISDLDFLPNLRVHHLRYDVEEAKLTLESSPGAASFENAIITQLVRHRALPNVPVGLLGWRAPQAQQPLSVLRAVHPLVLVDVDIPVLGRLEVRIHPDDTLRVSLSSERWTVQSERKVLLLAPDIDLVLEVASLVYDFSTNSLALDASLTPNDYGGAFLVGLLESFAWPPLQKLVELPKPDQPWTLYRVPGALGGIDISLDAGDTLHITRGPRHLGVSVDQGLWVRPAQAAILGGPVRLRRLSLELPSGALGLQTLPSVGELTISTAQRLLEMFAPGVLNPILTRLGVETLAPHAPQTPQSPKASIELFSQTLPVIGALRVFLDTAATVSIGLDERQLRLTLNEALRLSLPGLKLEHSVRTLALNLSGNWTVHLDTNPPLGGLEKRIIEGQLRAHLKPLVASILPPHQHPAHHPEDHVLLVLGQGKGWGPLSISAHGTSPLVLTLTPRMFTMTVEGGLSLRSPAIDPYLPAFRLSKLEYALGVGQISLDVCGIEQRFYHEEHDVGSTTEQLIEYALKALVAPALPQICHQLGIVGFDDDEGDLEQAEGIRLLQVPLGGALGAATVALDPDDQIEIGFEGQEIILKCEEGLLVVLDALRFSTRIEEVRYHLASGEVFVKRFGQFENALIEALLARAFGPSRLVEGVSYAPLGAFLEEKPLHPEHGRELLQVPLPNIGIDLVTCYLDIGAELRLTLNAQSLKFTASPGLLIDGPGAVDLRADGFHYSFAEARFTLALRKDNPLAGLFSGALRKGIEALLNSQLRKYLPDAMRQPGYTLSGDPHSAEHIAQLIHRFSVKKKEK